MSQYFHEGKGRIVECKQAYGGQVSCYDGGEQFWAQPSELSPVDGQQVVKEVALVASTTPNTPDELRLANQAPQTQTQQDSVPNINTLSASEIANLLPGIGRLRAKQIHSRKPTIGYESWGQLAEINADLPVEWNAISSEVQVRFS